MTTCERCKKVFDDDEVETVERLVCRQTHWEPAEYETQVWCVPCVTYHAEFTEDR